MIELVALILAIIIGGISVINKTEVALLKDNVREKHQISDFSFMSNRALMGYMSGVFLTPLIFLINLNSEIIFFILLFSILRYLTWSRWTYLHGMFSNAKQQATTKYTLLEGYVGPAASALVFGIAFLINTNFTSFLIWISIGCFTLFIAWLFRDSNEKLSKEMKKLLLFQGLVVIVETLALQFFLNKEYSNNENLEHVTNILPFLNEGFIVFLVTIGISSIFSGIKFHKYLINEIDKVGRKGVLLGTVSGLHDALYFSAFAYAGPSFLIFRRFLMIPIQTIYLSYREIKNQHNKEHIKVFWQKIINSAKLPPLESKDGRVIIAGLMDQAFSIPARMLAKLL